MVEEEERLRQEQSEMAVNCWGECKAVQYLDENSLTIRTTRLLVFGSCNWN